MGIECCRCPTSLILLLSFLLFPLFTQSLPVRSTRQYLPPIPGYVPVYIQDGETPPDIESIVYEKKANDPVKISDGSEDIVNPSSKSVEARNIDDELKRSEEEIVRQLTMQQARFFPSSREKRMNKYSLNHYVSSMHHSIKVPS